MDSFKKITNGWVEQIFEENDAGEFVCVDQEFICGDMVEYVDAVFEQPIDPPKYCYQPYNMCVCEK